MNNSKHKLKGQGGVEQSFDGLGIAPKILEVLERIRFRSPTPIQVKAIPLAIQGKDVIGIAQTGTGKTHSFAIPMIQHLARARGAGLVIAPTRELAIQINDAFQPLAYAFGMKTACLIGGAPMNPQREALRQDPRVVIATPGRLIDHIGQWNFMPEEVSMLVLDEADRMLDMGFAPQINKILRCLPRQRQTMLFSATMPPEIMEIAAKHMKLPVSVEIAPSGTTAERVTQEVFIIKKYSKDHLLNKLLDQYQGVVLLFCRTKHGAKKVRRSIREMGYSAAEIHSNRSLLQRQQALEGFKSGKYRVLVATDIAARGIDVTGIELVINYDLPDDAENYVHRIGRTGRAGHKGHAISFATPDQAGNVRDIEKIIRAAIPISQHPGMPAEKFIEHSAKEAFSKGRRRHSSGRSHFQKPARRHEPKRPFHKKGRHR